MQVTGDKELVAALRALGRGLPGSAIDGAMKSAAAPMLNDAVERARTHRQPGRRPKGGHLDEGIIYRKAKKSTRNRRDYVIGATNRARYILHLLEFGVAPHVQPIRLHGGIHPGHKPFPIMRPAYDENSEKIPERFGRDIWKYVEAMALALSKGRK